MKTDQQPDPTKTVSLQTVSVAIAHLKQRLQRDYEKTYPELRDVIHLVLDEEETNAWKLTLFPHLLFPDLVEAHVEKLNLQPADTAHRDVLAPLDSPKGYRPAFALCG